MSLYGAYFTISGVDPSGLQSSDGPSIPLGPGGGLPTPGADDTDEGAGGGIDIDVMPGLEDPMDGIEFNLPDVGCYSIVYGRSQFEKVPGPPLLLIATATGGCNGVDEAEVDEAAELALRRSGLSVGFYASNGCPAGECCSNAITMADTYRDTGLFPVPILSLSGQKPCYAIVVVTYQVNYTATIGTCIPQ